MGKANQFEKHRKPKLKGLFFRNIEIVTEGTYINFSYLNGLQPPEPFRLKP